MEFSGSFTFVLEHLYNPLMRGKGLLIYLSVLTAAALIGSAGCQSGLESEDLSVRKAAVEKLTDQALLAKVEIEDKSPEVRLAAKNRISTFWSRQKQ